MHAYCCITNNTTSIEEKCRSKSRRCGACENCIKADCGMCKFCKDKPRFGGPGRLKQACSQKKCLKLTKPKAGEKVRTYSQ